MAVDSIIAKPTNSVRVMVAEASGCCASAVSAVATARPSASAGPMVPKPVVRPAMMIEATAMSVWLSMSFSGCDVKDSGLRRGLLRSDRRGDVDRRQDAEDVGLDHAGEQAEQGHDDRKKEGRD